MHHIYCKYSDCYAGANSVDQGQAPQTVVSDQGSRTVCHFFAIFNIQSNLVISNSLILNYGLSRSENLVPVFT